ncbi:MAG: sulfur carrier protein ThiS adenylyltransferase ThiF [Acidobacteriota bacterium]|nr:sulfur carrier protein ThiS adenylyltransferase ThiF [Acidobacteriota bacterium]
MTDLEKEFLKKRDLGVLAALQGSIVGIAGAGGLGSNAAACLARAGVGRLIIADFDVVEPSDLNRQYYFVDQIGRPKVEALADNLRRMNPFSTYDVHTVWVDSSNVASLFDACDLLIEAFDAAGEKQMLVETWLRLFPDRPLIVASGLAGFGGNNALRQRDLGGLFIIGDEASECGECSAPTAPRVAAVAAMQANLAVELLIRMKAR